MSESGSVKTTCMDSSEIERSLTRMAHEILEANKGADNLVIVGIVTRGDILARELAQRICAIEGVDVPIGRLDISFYRDDFASYISPEVLSTDIPCSIDGRKVVLVDDVLFTGRTIRCALDALMDIGRPSCVLVLSTAEKLCSSTTSCSRAEPFDARSMHLWTSVALRAFSLQCL